MYMLDRKSKKRSKENEEVVYLVYTDVVGSSELDKESEKVIKWRKKTFFTQLKSLLGPDQSLVLKSIGDALFILYDSINKDVEENFVKEILYYLHKAFVKTIKPSIRAVVHRITNHKRGKEIKTYLQRCKNKQKNMKYLTDTLEKDIFGKEVNKAARMLSLVHAPAILVSQDVVNQISKQADEKAIKGESINVNYRRKKLILHSPVPVLYMKGVFNYHDEKASRIPYVIWELGVIKDATLAPEFKLNQTFRLITARLSNAVMLANRRDEILQITMEKLSFGNPDLALRFYVDMLWEVTDYFIFQNPEFERKERQIKRNNYLNSLSNLISKTPPENNIQIEGQAGKLTINFNTCSIDKLTYSAGGVPDKEFVISLLVFTSFPDISHQNQIRKLLSRENQSGLVKEIEPQSIQIYQSIKFGGKFIKGLDTGQVFDNFSGFSGKTSILLMFQVYFECLKDADNLASLFEGVEKIEDNNLTVACYGLTAGLIDGFVLYSIDTWEAGLKSILTKFIAVTDAKDFYYKISPVAAFILKPSCNFSTLKNNIRYLQKVFESEEYSNDVPNE